jgi:aminoglycoside 2'-N-acetyltransferase I
VIGIRTLPSAALTRQETRTLRRLFAEAWPDEEFREEDWANAVGGLHVVAEEDGRILSHASVVPRELRAVGRSLRTGYVEAMATWPELQRRGLGSRVLSVVNDHIASIYELGALDTGSPSFYERSGWIRWRGPTSVRTDGGDLPTPEEDGNVMVLLTSATMDLDLDGPISCEWRPGDVW